MDPKLSGFGCSSEFLWDLLVAFELEGYLNLFWCQEGLRLCDNAFAGLAPWGKSHKGNLAQGLCPRATDLGQWFGVREGSTLSVLEPAGICFRGGPRHKA